MTTGHKEKGRKRMRAIHQRCLHQLRRFRDDSSGAIAFEALIVLPLLFFVLILSVVYYDAFRTMNTNAKAAYVVSDLISRQTAPVTPDYLDGLGQVYASLSGGRHPTWLRVSSIDRDPKTEALRIRWTHATGDMDPLTDARLNDLKHRVPKLSTGETVVLVETLMDYIAPTTVGPSRTLSHVIPTRPRFVPRIVFHGATS